MVFIMMDQNNNYNAYNSYDNSGDQSYVDHYDAASGQGSSYSNYYSDPSSGQNDKKPSGGKVFLKVLAGLAALAIVSVSSIEMYKLFGQDNAKNWTADAESESEAATSSTDDSDSTADSGNDSESTKATAAAASNWISSAAREDALTIPQIVEKAMPSVVGISSVFEYTPSNSFNNWGFDFYNFYGGGGGNQQQQTSQFTATGSGIVMTEDGYVITNAHCIYDDESEVKAGKAVSVSVVMGDENETEYEAQIVGYDLQTDLAVLKIDATGLTPAEFGIMTTHTMLGADFIERTLRETEDTEYYQMAHDVALYHHERWDGKGYPKGLQGTQIPLCARIMAVADVYDALTSPRPYKDKMPCAEVLQYIREHAGTQFDPAIVQVLDRIQDRMETISLYV